MVDDNCIEDDYLGDDIGYQDLADDDYDVIEDAADIKDNVDDTEHQLYVDTADDDEHAGYVGDGGGDVVDDDGD